MEYTLSGEEATLIENYRQLSPALQQYARDTFLSLFQLHLRLKVELAAASQDKP